MRYLITLSLLSGAIAFGTQLSACGGDDGGADDERFDNFQDCWDDHTGANGGDEHLPADQAIVICCIDHPIGSNDSNVVCGDTAASCSTYVSANLSTASASSDVVTAACADYVTKRNE
ncbi:MAG TPA: hypothetical protein VGM39_02755 [Kofleriaceae bacterium]|jgi:hypothetical protein